MPRKAYLKCYFSCINDSPLHKFPNPNALKMEDINRFQEWKSVLDVAEQKKPDHYIFDNIRICDRHFDQCYQLPSYRLTRNAVPTLCLGKNILCLYIYNYTQTYILVTIIWYHSCNKGN